MTEKFIWVPSGVFLSTRLFSKNHKNQMHLCRKLDAWYAENGSFFEGLLSESFQKKKKKKNFHFFLTPKKKKQSNDLPKTLAHPIKWTVKNRVFFASIFRKNRVFRENRENRSFFKNAQKPRFQRFSRFLQNLRKLGFLQNLVFAAFSQKIGENRGFEKTRV